MKVVNVFQAYVGVTADYKTALNKLLGNRVAGLDVSEELFVNWLGKDRKKQAGFDSINLKIEQKIVSLNSGIDYYNRVEHINVFGVCSDLGQPEKLGKVIQ